jgi:hypothetical protein
MIELSDATSVRDMSAYEQSLSAQRMPHNLGVMGSQSTERRQNQRNVEEVTALLTAREEDWMCTACRQPSPGLAAKCG